MSALALVIIFLALHIANHLMFPAGEGTYDAVMKVFRHVYRNDILQPLVVALFLFQVGTGLFFVWRLTAAPSDRFRTFQIASGVYLAFYVLGHMNSVFIFARTYLGIDTGWGFATGAPAGTYQGPVEHPPPAALLARRILRPRASCGWRACGHYGAWREQGVCRPIHGRRRSRRRGIATVIMLGMCGMRVQFV